MILIKNIALALLGNAVGGVLIMLVGHFLPEEKQVLDGWFSGYIWVCWNVYVSMKTLIELNK